MSPCYLELVERSKALRVNCFHIEGVLHIHSSRWAKLPRLTGESWIVTVRRAPNVRVEIEGRIYTLQASPINDESLRNELWSSLVYADEIKRRPGWVFGSLLHSQISRLQ
jgi:hypothetical protein